MSASELEEAYNGSLLRHAAQCVGLDFDRDVRGLVVHPTYASLAEIDEGDLVRVLGSYHSSEKLLQDLVTLVCSDVTVTEHDTDLIAAHSLRTDVSHDIVDRFVTRLHKIYRNPVEAVPLEVVREAEIALRRHNARQKDAHVALQRVFHACEQLQLQSKSRTRHRQESAHSDRPTSAHTELSVGRSSVDSAGSRKNPADAVSKLLLHLKKRAQAEKAQILREVLIRENLQGKDGSSSVDEKSVTTANRSPSRNTSTSLQGSYETVSARRERAAEQRSRAFQEGLAEHVSKLQRAEQQSQQTTSRQLEEELRIGSAIDNAQRRRFEFLRNRELRCRASDQRCASIHRDVAQRKALDLADAAGDREHHQEESERALQERTEQQEKEKQRKQSATRMRQALAKQRAEAIKNEAIKRAIQKEEAYTRKVAACEKSEAERLAVAAQHNREVERHRREALQKAKALERQKIHDTERLRNILDDDQEKRSRRNEYLASLRKEENKIKDEQRRNLVRQYAKAREYRENAFREQWDHEINRLKNNEKSTKALSTAMHQLQLREETKLKKILSEQCYKHRDVQKLDEFIAELDSLLID